MRRFFLWGPLFVYLVLLPSEAWSQPREILVHMTPQVLEPDQTVSWEQILSKRTRAGSPVVLNIDAEGLGIRISVTPFFRGPDFLLVVQGDIRQKSEGSMRGASTVQSLLVPPSEPLAFFPLGRSPDGSRQMVVFIRAEVADD